MKKIALFFIFLMTFFACETAIEIEVPKHDSSLVVHCNTSNLHGLTKAYVGKSVGILDNEEPQQIGDVEISIWKDGSWVSDFIYSEGDQVYLSETNYVIDGLGEYELRVKENDGTEHFITQRMPTAPSVKEPNYRALDLYDLFNDTNYDIIDFVLEDNDIGETEFYFAQGYIKYHSSGNFVPLFTFSENPILGRTPNGEGLIFSDESFNGKTIALSVNVSNHFYNPDFHDLYLRVSKITPEKFLYLESMARYQDALENPFAEPIIVYSNIPGGFGLFGIEHGELVLVE